LDDAPAPGSGSVERPLGVFVTRPRVRFLTGAILPWITAVLLATAIWPLIPDHAMYHESPLWQLGRLHPHLTFADRTRFFYQGLTLLPLLLIPPYLIMGTAAKPMLRLLALRIALLWRGWPLAGICLGIGMAIGILVVGFYQVLKFQSNEHFLALCSQWDSVNQGHWLDDPRCGSAHWDWALMLIPGGGAGLVYWLVRYRPRDIPLRW
jgi:hypothetical protein